MGKRIIYYDCLRVLACLCVVMIHVSAFLVTKSDVYSIDYAVGNTFNSISRIGVPIFIMISGALFLDESYRFTKKKLICHVVKLLIFYIFWSSVYSLIFNVIIPQSNGIETSFLLFWRGFRDSYYHLWFIPMLIALYLITPLLRLWIKKENIKYINYFMLISIVFAFVIPQVIDIFICFSNKYTEDVAIILNKVKVYQVYGMVPYYVLGWVINNFTIKRNYIVYAVGILGLLVSIFGSLGASYYTNSVIQIFYEPTSLNILATSIMIFALFKKLFPQKECGGGYTKLFPPLPAYL